MMHSLQSSLSPLAAGGNEIKFSFMMLAAACSEVHGDKFMPWECGSRHHPGEKLKTFSSPAEHSSGHHSLSPERCKIDALNSTTLRELGELFC